MPDNESAEPLYKIIRKVRHKLPLREIIAACLRSINNGDPFNTDPVVLPAIPTELESEVEIRERIISGIRCLIYSPKKSSRSLPVMLYMHGGGFVIGCAEDTDYVTRMLCHSNQMIVISIEYRLAPETIFPGALLDCEKVLNWIIEHGLETGVDNQRLYLAGDSAGGNLAISLYFRVPQHRAFIKGIVLLAPWLDMEVENYSSYNRLAPESFVFDSAFLAYSRAAYLRFEDWKNPSASPLLATLKDLPPTIALIGDDDPLVDQTIRLHHIAQNLGLKQIETRIYKGMPHSFYSFPSVFEAEKHCYQGIAEFIERTGTSQVNLSQ